MKIAVIGATGMVGSAIVTEALSREHVALGLSRRARRPVAAGPLASGRPEEQLRGAVQTAERLRTSSLDVSDTGGLAAALTGMDAAVLTIRLEAGQEHHLGPLTTGVLDAAASVGTRVLVVGGAGPLACPEDADRQAITDPRYVPPAYRAVARASIEQLETCQRHPRAGWVYLSPPAFLEPGVGTGNYRRGTTTLLVDRDGQSRITVGDLAVAVLDELENPGVDRHFTVAGRR